MRLIDADYLTTEIARLVVGGKHAIEEAGHGNFWINGLYDVKKIIDNAPTVEINDKSLEIARKSIELGRKVGKLEGKLERPQGEWIYKKFDVESGIPHSYWCSNCGEPKSQLSDNFCACCGAKMGGDSEDESSN